MFVDSAEELVRLLPGMIEEEAVDFLLVNGTRWRSLDLLLERVRAASGIVTDFDGTLVVGSHWEDFLGLMTEEYRLAQLEDAAAYFAGGTSEEGDRAFFLRTCDRLCRSRVRRDAMEQAARRQWPRRGVREFLGSFPSRHAAIASYGMYPYLDYWSAFHRVSASRIYAARADWTLYDNVQSFESVRRDTIVTAAGKNAARAAFAAERRLAENELLLLEDTPHMLAQMRHDDNVAALLVPRRDPQPHRVRERFRQLADPARFAAIDAVYLSDGFESFIEFRPNR